MRGTIGGGETESQRISYGRPPPVQFDRIEIMMNKKTQAGFRQAPDDGAT